MLISNNFKNSDINDDYDMKPQNKDLFEIFFDKLKI